MDTIEPPHRVFRGGETLSVTNTASLLHVLVERCSAARTCAVFIATGLIRPPQIRCSSKIVVVPHFTVVFKELFKIVHRVFPLYPSHAVHIRNRWKLPALLHQFSGILKCFRHDCIALLPEFFSKIRVSFILRNRFHERKEDNPVKKCRIV